MKACKKILALLLSVLMVFTMISSSVVAIEATTDKTEIESVEINVTNIFDTIKGIDSMFTNIQVMVL